MSLVWSLGRVTQVVMHGLVYYPFHFVGKKIILNTLGRVARSYELYAGRKNFRYPHGIYFRGFHKKNCFKMEWCSFCSYMGPNQERIMDQMVSRLSTSAQVSFIKTGTYKGIGQRLIMIGFWVYVSVVLWFDGLPLVTFLFICSKLYFEFLQASSD